MGLLAYPSSTCIDVHTQWLPPSLPCTCLERPTHLDSSWTQFCQYFLPSKSISRWAGVTQLPERSLSEWSQYLKSKLIIQNIPLPHFFLFFFLERWGSCVAQADLDPPSSASQSSPDLSFDPILHLGIPQLPHLLIANTNLKPLPQSATRG